MEPIAAPLLQWFNANKRLLPFRQEPSAYHIWVSEIMLQQTRVAAAIPYYERFIAALPDPAALAACEPDALRKLWQGLGYYNRVNNMQKAARIVCEQYGGDLPADYDALRSLPGIGDYTAGAVASIAFGIPAPAVDGNVLRVFARLYNDDADVMNPATKRLFTERVLAQMPKATPGPYSSTISPSHTPQTHSARGIPRPSPRRLPRHSRRAAHTLSPCLSTRQVPKPCA